MITSINTRFEIDYKDSKETKIIDIIEDLRLLNIPQSIRIAIKDRLENEDWGSTVCWINNNLGVNFWFYTSISSGGIEFDFETYNKTKD